MLSVCSSLQANEMLLFGRKISATTARDWGLVTEVYPDASFDSDIQKRLKEIADLPKQVGAGTLFDCKSASAPFTLTGQSSEHCTEL